MRVLTLFSNERPTQTIDFLKLLKMSRILPDTSLAANKAAVAEMRQEHCAKIIQALKELKTANYEVIGKHCGLDRHQVGRRLSELERAQIVYKPGLKSATSSGRAAYNYSLTSESALSPIQTVEQMIENVIKSEPIQKELFE